MKANKIYFHKLDNDFKCTCIKEHFENGESIVVEQCDFCKKNKKK